MNTSTRTTRRISARAIAVPALVLVSVTALAACSSDSKSSTASSSTTTKAASGDTKAVVIKTADNPNLGTILVDSSGKTVYTLTSNGAAVACSGGCLTAWPPVKLPAGETTATGASGVKDLGVVTGTAGDQVTSKGFPLYTFVQDTAAGDAKGEGITSFGGTWHVVKVGASATASTTTTTSGSSGY